MEVPEEKVERLAELLPKGVTIAGVIGDENLARRFEVTVGDGRLGEPPVERAIVVYDIGDDMDWEAMIGHFHRLRGVQYPYLARATDVGFDRDAGLVWIASPAPGGEKASEMTETLSTQEFPGFFRCLVESLASMHERGLVHGGVCMDNVMVDRAGKATRAWLSGAEKGRLPDFR